MVFWGEQRAEEKLPVRCMLSPIRNFAFLEIFKSDKIPFDFFKINLADL